MIPGIDTYDLAANYFSDCRGVVIIDGAGHWVQQEAPEETNEVLLHFLEEVN